jgi:hypothetical protein
MGSRCPPGVISIEVLVERHVFTEVFVFLEMGIESVYLALPALFLRKIFVRRLVSSAAT